MATNNAINVGVVAGGGNTYTFPAATDTLVGRTSTDTLTNKTIQGAAITGALTGTGAYVPVTLLNSGTSASSSTFWRGDGTWATPAGGGTVTNTGGSLTANAVVLGAGTNDTKVVAGITTDGTSVLNLGVNTTTIGKVKMFGNTSGDATIQPAAVAGTATVLTLPAVTGTLATLAGTETFTNKTLTSPVLTTPVINGVSTGTGVAIAATVSTLALRDSNGSLTAVAFNPGVSFVTSAAGTTTLTIASNQVQYVTGSTTQTIQLPVVSTLPLGTMYRVINNSTGNVTVQSSGGNSVFVLRVDASALFFSIATSGTDNTVWDYYLNTVTGSSGKTLTVSNTLTLSGTDGTVMTFPTTTATIARTDAAQTFTGVQTFSSAPVLSTSTITIGGNTNTFQSVADTVVYRATTDTLTNKNVTRRLVTVSAPGATPTTTVANVDIANFTALGAAITSMSTNLVNTGAVDGQLIEFRFTDNGTARAITWGASFGSTTVTLPTTTVISTMLRVLVEYNGSIWQCIAVA